ncbi:MAG: CPBP family intramembrane metalloprotease [Rhodobacteraceae bacterium]|nr:CPBP family intramembrane metalloprotease [Paracoccaceae bacterium]
MSHRPYPFFEALIAPARPSATLPRLLIGSVVVVMGFFTFLYLASILLRSFLPPPLSERMSTALEDGGTTIGVLGNLFVFGFVILALNVALRWAHGRGILSLLGPAKLATLQFRRVAAYLVGLHVAISLLVPAGDMLTPQANLDLALWLSLLPIALCALLIQTSAEELVFRGYLQSQLAAQFRTPLVWMLVPAIIFALLHYTPEMNGNSATVIVLWTMAFGLVAADITARAGTLGPAIALHFMNNFAAILLTAPQGNFDGLALYTVPISLTDGSSIWAWAPVEFMVLFCSWLTARIAIRR